LAFLVIVTSVFGIFLVSLFYFFSFFRELKFPKTFQTFQTNPKKSDFKNIQVLKKVHSNFQVMQPVSK